MLQDTAPRVAATGCAGAVSDSTARYRGGEGLISLASGQGGGRWALANGCPALILLLVKPIKRQQESRRPTTHPKPLCLGIF